LAAAVSGVSGDLAVSGGLAVSDLVGVANHHPNPQEPGLGGDVSCAGTEPQGHQPPPWIRLLVRRFDRDRVLCVWLRDGRERRDVATISVISNVLYLYD